MKVEKEKNLPIKIKSYQDFERRKNKYMTHYNIEGSFKKEYFRFWIKLQDKLEEKSLNVGKSS